MTTVLVTAATGAVGTILVPRLLDAGVAVRAITRSAASARRALGPAVALVEGDLDDGRVLAEAVVGVDAVFVGCGNGPGQVGREVGVVDAAVAAGVGRLVKLSAEGAAVGSPVAFWDDHARIEEHLRSVAPRATVLRPTFFASNLLGFAGAVARTDCLPLAAGEARVAIIDPADVAAAAAAAIVGEGDGGTFHLTGPVALTFDEVAMALSSVLGRSITYVDVPDDDARVALVAAGGPPWVVEPLLALFAALRAGAHAEVTDDVAHLTGRPAVGVPAWLRRHAAAFA